MLISQTLDALEYKLEELNRRIVERENGMITERRLTGLRKLQEEVKNLKYSMKELETWDVKTGRVVASSGYRLSDTGCSLDWALIDIDTERAGTNLVPSYPPYWPSETELEVIGEVDTKGDVVKFRRNGAAKPGSFSHLQSRIRLDHGEESKEMVFVSGPGEDPFARRGDSGAFILGLKDPAPSLVGMVIGGHIDKGWAYITPIRTLIKDIEKRTGRNVRLPV